MDPGAGGVGDVVDLSLLHGKLGSGLPLGLSDDSVIFAPDLPTPRGPRPAASPAAEAGQPSEGKSGGTPRGSDAGDGRRRASFDGGAATTPRSAARKAGGGAPTLAPPPAWLGSVEEVDLPAPQVATPAQAAHGEDEEEQDEW
jgi:hypothetical protein